MAVPLWISGIAVWITLGLWSLVVNLNIVNAVAGFWGVVLGIVLFPVIMAVAPIYAWAIWGDSGPALLSWSTPLLGSALFLLGSAFAEPVRRPNRLVRVLIVLWTWFVAVTVLWWLLDLVLRTPSWWDTWRAVGDILTIWTFGQWGILLLPLFGVAIWCRQLQSMRSV